jgi:hypothetical protein
MKSSRRNKVSWLSCVVPLAIFLILGGCKKKVPQEPRLFAKLQEVSSFTENIVDIVMYDNSNDLLLLTEHGTLYTYNADSRILTSELVAENITEAVRIFTSNDRYYVIAKDANVIFTRLANSTEWGHVVTPNNLPVDGGNVEDYNDLVAFQGSVVYWKDAFQGTWYVVDTAGSAVVDISRPYSGMSRVSYITEAGKYFECERLSPGFDIQEIDKSAIGGATKFNAPAVIGNTGFETWACCNIGEYTLTDNTEVRSVGATIFSTAQGLFYLPVEGTTASSCIDPNGDIITTVAKNIVISGHSIGHFFLSTDNRLFIFTIG